MNRSKDDTKIVNKKLETYDVYIGRPSVFGNPYVIGKDGTRDEVIGKYRKYFWTKIREDARFRCAVLALRGKILGCFCAPQACHGDVIVDALKIIK